MGIPGLKTRRRRAVALSGQDADVVDRLARRSHDEQDEDNSSDVKVLSHVPRRPAHSRRERTKGR